MEANAEISTCPICGGDRTESYCPGCVRRGFGVTCKAVGEVVVTVKKLEGE